MNFTDEEAKLSGEAIAFIKKNKRFLIEKFADIKKFPPDSQPASIFMAGSPGAGKTEVSKETIKTLGKNRVVRIDADEIRNIIPIYTGNNSYIVQGACGLGVDYLYDYVMNKNQNFVLDGTFAKYEIAFKNVKRSVDKGRLTQIFYLYQDPAIAWSLTQMREKLEGRYVPFKIFHDSFINARSNVNLIKSVFGKKIKLNLVIRNYKQEYSKLILDIESIDLHLPRDYGMDTINKLYEENLTN